MKRAFHHLLGMIAGFGNLFRRYPKMEEPRYPYHLSPEWGHDHRN